MRIAAIILAALPCIALAEPITLKGLAPGMTKAQVNEMHSPVASGCMTRERDPTTDEMCGYSTKVHSGIPALHTFADVNVGSWVLMFKGGVVHTVMVSFGAGDYDRIEEALSERWGKPVSRKAGTVKNRMGAEFDQIEATWTRDGSVLRAAKRGSKVDEGSLMLTTSRSMQSRDQERKDAAKKAAKDM